MRNNSIKIVFGAAVLSLAGLLQTAKAQQTPPAAYSSSTPFNYVREWDAMAPDPSASDLITRAAKDVRQTTSYYDGLGRVIQKVVKDYTPAGNDFVTPYVYDNMNRENYRYLSFPATIATTGDVTTDGNIKLDPFQQQSTFYTNTQILQNQGEKWFYRQVNYEVSPLGRVQAMYPEGNNWIGATKGITQQYLTNSAADNVQIWTLTASFTSVPNSTPPVPTSSGAYAAGMLYKMVTADAAGNQVVVFTDIEGKVILKQVQAVASPGTNHSGWLNTYYIYDNLNKLRYVLQPQAVSLLLSNSTWSLTAVPKLLTGLCFYYEYDQRGRLIIKQIPGAQPEYMVYDALDRMVMRQDGNMRAQSQWLVSVYENNLDRVTETGLLSSTTAFATHLANAYTSTSYPSTSSGFTLLTQLFYDTYSWTSGTPLSGGFDASQSSAAGFQTASNSTWPYPQAVTQTPYTTTGLVTGTQAAVLGSSTFLYTANYYDDHDRVIQTQSSNITGGIDETTNQYTFDGLELVTQTKEVKNGTNAQTNTVQSVMTYDGEGRLTGISKSFTGAAGTVTKNLVTNTYNELNGLWVKGFEPASAGGAGTIDQLTYDYNIRNWLLGINRNYLNSASTIAITNAAPTPGNYFAEELAYDKLTSYSPMTYTAAQLNGNIAGSVWKSTGDAVPRKYDFTYDNANRMTAANFSQVTPTNAVAVSYAVSNMTYDANGNILTMNQAGFRLGSPTGLIDQLTYNYYSASNQLQNVVDAANNPQTILDDFRSSTAYMTALGNTKSNAAYDYYYDANGNLVTDQNKDMGTLNNSTGALATQGITYNYLSLPQQVTFNSGKGTIQYIYDAHGNKLQKITTENSGSVTYNGTSYTGVQVVTTTTYIGQFIFQSVSYPNNSTLNTSTLQHGDILQFVVHEEGRIRPLYTSTTSSSTVTGYAFDYFVKDHVGNTRMILTDEVASDPPYLATMETANATAEQAVFGNIASTRTAKPAGFDNNSSNQEVALTNFSTGSKIGPSLILKVMAGDMLSISVNAYYNSTSGTNDNIGTLLATDLLTNLLSTATGIPATGSAHAAVADLQNNSSVLNSSTTIFLNNRTAPNANVPKAYLNYVFLDDQFQYAGGYAAPITSAMSSAAQALKPSLYPVAAPKNGYVYVYVSNESNYNVYFDNLQVIYQHGPILEDNAYYPFGLTMVGISDKAIKLNYAENKFRYLAKELQNKEFTDGSGMEDYELGARFFDPQIGRFNTIDPYVEYMKRWSPYAYGFDNPERFVDPNGMQGNDTVNKTDFFLDKNGNVQNKQLDDVTVTPHKSTFWGWVNRAVDIIPFVGSTKQIIMGIYHGDWKEAAMGAVFLVVDVATAGEGGELAHLAEEGVEVLEKDEVKEAVEDELKEGVEGAEKDGAEEGAKGGEGESSEGGGEKEGGKEPCGCFLAGTLIYTDHGFKKIEDIRPGDLVWSYNDTTKAYAKKKVTRLFSYDRDTVYLIHIGKDLVQATSDHPFFVAGRWLKVGELKAGDSVVSYGGRKMAITRIEILAKRSTVFNFEVADYHSYYVSEDKILVHNAGGCANKPKPRSYEKPIGKRFRFNSKKEAREAAKRAGKGDPVHHYGGEHGSHYHPGDGAGKPLNHDHYYYGGSHS